jgi:hypothetical protein
VNPEVVYADGEEAAIRWLLTAMESRWDGELSVGRDLPSSWTPDAPPHLLVVSDGTPSGVHPIEAYQTIRLVAFAKLSPTAKRICAVAHAALIAHPGGDGVSKVQFLTGVLPAKDHSNGAELASATVRVAVQAVPVA